MNRIDRVFARAKESNRKVFIPFLVAGDPDLKTTMRVASELADQAETAGVPIILELGFPYSDPLADGPTIQDAYTRALERGVRVDEIFAAVQQFRQQADFPIVGMVAYSIVYRRHPHEFLTRAKDAGFDGFIIPDLPVEEADAIDQWAKQNDFKIIQLIAPTTREDRIQRIASASSGFLYYISVTGITGERKSLPPDLIDRVKLLRSHASVPIAIGFGISDAAHVRTLAPLADGIIVGSALVRRVAQGDIDGVVKFVQELIQPLKTTAS